MADFAPPPGPPPPKVPEGWKAVWNDQYKEWFYVNTYTKASQWDKPTQPVYPTGDAAPAGAPPGYDHSSARPVSAEKGSNNPYGQQSGLSEDEKLARKLQAEEEARAGGASRGASDGYYGGAAPTYGQQCTSPYGQSASPYGQQSASPYGQELPPREEKRGLFSKFSSKLGGGSSSRPQQQYGGYPPQQHYGGYSQQGYPPQQYGGYPQQGGYMQQQAPKRSGMGGMGAGLLGAGAGLVGGAMLMDAVEDHDQNEYNQGYEQGQDNGGGGDDGGDYGGGDDGGGDF